MLLVTHHNLNFLTPLVRSGEGRHQNLRPQDYISTEMLPVLHHPISLRTKPRPNSEIRFFLKKFHSSYIFAFDTDFKPLEKEIFSTHVSMVIPSSTVRYKKNKEK